MEDEYRFATMPSLELSPCTVCHGISKDKCIFCGCKCPAKKDLNEKQVLQLDCWREKIAFLKKTYLQLIALNQRTTQIPELDAEIRRLIGNWLPMLKGRPSTRRDATCPSKENVLKSDSVKSVES
jgi:hypothetical protein